MRRFMPRGLRLTATSAAGVLAVCALAAACSSSGSTAASTGSSQTSAAGSATGSAQANAPTGTAIKLGIIANEGTAVDSSASVAAAQGAVRDVNAHGGIAGHPVQLVYCNEGLDPNKARACARSFVSDHVMAAVGDQVVTAESDVDSILRAAGIPDVAPYSYSNYSATDPNSYPIYGGGQYSNAAMISAAVHAGYKRVAAFELSNPAWSGYVPLMSKATTALGGTWVGSVTVPQVTSDLSTQAAALMSMNPQVLVMNAATPSELQVMKDMTQLGYTGKFLTDGGQPETQSQLTSLGTIDNSFVDVSSFPPLSATRIPGIAQYRSDMEAEKAAGDSNAPTDTGFDPNNDLNAWLGVIATAKIANTAKASDAASLKSALAKAINVDLDGLTPPWTPNKAAPEGAVYPRVTDGSFYFSAWTNGQMTLVSSSPADVSSLVNKYAPQA